MAQTTITREEASGWRAGAGLRSLLLLLVLPAMIFTGVFVYALHERGLSVGPSSQGALVWSNGGVIFANTDEIASWIKQHGGDFATFKRNHPAAVDLVSGKKTARPGSEAGSAGARAGDAVAIAGVDSSSSPTHRIGLIVLGMVAALLLILALSPKVLLFRLRVAHPANANEARLAVGAAATAVTAGLAVALLV